VTCIGETQKWVKETWDRLDKKMQISAPKMKGKIPYTTENGHYDNFYERCPDWWTNGFWGGMMWILYKKTNRTIYRDAALDCERLLDKAFYEYYQRLHHDVGFLWNITAGIHYRLEGDTLSKRRVLEAANLLAARFNIKGQFIRAWGGAERSGWTIIDTMMNLPLLYRASQITGDMRYSYVAQAHADMTMRDHVRSDGSVFHIVQHDEFTGECTGYPKGQGFAPESSWARGQAWAIYGFTLSYIFTGKQEYLDIAKRVAHYFIAAVCEDFLPRCDFRAPAEPILYDSTAGVCAACGLLELANQVGEYEKEMYRSAAVRMLKAIDKAFCNWNPQEDSVLQMGSHSYHKVEERHRHIIYGDFFLTEALYKLSDGEILFW